MANVKAIYLDSNGVYRPAGESDTLDVGDIKLLNQDVLDGVLSTDANGVVSSALLANKNVAADAAISGEKIAPNFGNQTIETTGAVQAGTLSGSGSAITSLNAGNLASGTIPDARFPSTLPAISGANLTNLDADELASGTVPSARISGSYSGITGVGTISTGTWQGGAIADTYLGTISSSGKVSNSATTADSANNGDTIVLRDIQGNFSAGVITADLTGDVTGNATSADKWSTERTVSFSGGDVSGSFDIDGSANVSAVDLTIGDAVVETAMLVNSSVTEIKIADGAVTNAKLATASALNVASNVVVRDASGDFSAGTITADIVGSLDGNAATASKWLNSRQVSFSGGDVSGSFDIDGSANVGSVALTIGSGVIEDSMIAAATISADKLAGSIPDSKLLQITTANKVADSALSSNVAKYDAATPVFANKLGVGAVTTTDVNKAATVQFVLDQVAAAEAGLDYKQEAQWYFNDVAGQAVLSDLVMLINVGWDAAYGIDIGPINGKFTAGDRILVISYDADESGIYVFSGSDGNWVLTRAADMAAGSDAAGAYVFCQTQVKVNAAGNPPVFSLTYPDINASYVCTDKKGDAVVGTDPLTFVQYGIAPTYTAQAPIVVNGTQISITLGSGVKENNGALEAAIDSSVFEFVQSGGDYVIGLKTLPSQFKINNSATNSTVTADGLNAVVADKNSEASAYHRHAATSSILANSGGIGAGRAVYFNGSDLALADKSAGKLAGIVLTSATAGNALVTSAGEASILSPVVTSGTLNAGDNVYLGSSGGFTNYASLVANDYVVKVGRYLGNDKVLVAVQEFGIKP